MRAPGLYNCGNDDRPLHSITDFKSTRYSFILRQNKNLIPKPNQELWLEQPYHNESNKILIN